MKNRVLEVLSRTQFQGLWQCLYKVSIGGLGFVNDDAARNGEHRFLSELSILAAERTKFVVFDVGANEGDFTEEVLLRIPNAEVHCFEPNPKTFQRLAKRFADNSRVVLNELAVGDADGTLTLYDYRGSDGSEHASMLRETFEDLYASETETCCVRVTTIDAYLAEKKIRAIDFFKVDVEGSEHSVFAGMHNLVASKGLGSVQFEFNEHNSRTGLTLYRISKMFPNHDIFRLLPNGLRAVKSTAVPYNSRSEIFKYSNHVLIPPGTFT